MTGAGVGRSLPSPKGAYAGMAEPQAAGLRGLALFHAWAEGAMTLFEDVDAAAVIR